MKYVIETGIIVLGTALAHAPSLLWKRLHKSVGGAIQKFNTIEVSILVYGIFLLPKMIAF